MIYKTHGVCSNSIEFEVEDDIIKSAKFNGGCSGNGSGISQLVAGMNIDDVITRLEAVKCGSKNTSCPAQLAEALKLFKSQK